MIQLIACFALGFFALWAANVAKEHLEDESVALRAFIGITFIVLPLAASFVGLARLALGCPA